METECAISKVIINITSFASTSDGKLYNTVRDFQIIVVVVEYV